MAFRKSCRQFLLLTWKNLIQLKRKLVQTIAVIVVIVFLPVLLLISRKSFGKGTMHEPSTESSFEITANYDLNGIKSKHILAFAPNNLKAQRIVARAVSLMGNDFIGVRGYDDELDLERDLQNSSLFCGIVFLESSFSHEDLSHNITYKIRPKEDWRKWYTNELISEELSHVGPRQNDGHKGGYEPGYFHRGFLTIQRAVDTSIIAELGGKVSSMTTFLKKFAFPGYSDDTFIKILQTQLSTSTMFGFFYISSVVCSEIVSEKQNKIKEYMKLLGLKNWVNWLAWFFKYAVLMGLSSALITIIYHAKVENVSVITYTYPLYTFLLIFLYALATLMLFFAFTTLFNKGRIASSVGSALFFSTYALEMYLSSKYDSLSTLNKIFISICPNIAFGLGCRIMLKFEGIGVGVQLETLGRGYNIGDSFSMLHVLWMLVLDMVLFGIITWYIDAIHPGEFGSPQPFYFPFLKRYWYGNARSLDSDKLFENPPNYGSRAEFFEPNNPNYAAGIKIRNLTKVFKKGSKPAVNGLNLDICEGNIVALLGHNGAGKTTTMSMLIGFFAPTKGDALISGFSINQHMDSIRQNLGYCPQVNILFDNMTVKEHLTFFAKLKGAKNDINSDISNMMTALSLVNKKDTFSKDLSGGMKRKLSIAIALIGGSEFVILDEPSSGLDTEARREIWDILKSHQQGRTMILSTHYMDEADYLADKIAIMAEGVLQCYGSSMFLKKKYGVGYQLTLMKNETSNPSKIYELITSEVPDAQLKSSAGAELTYYLPKESSSKFSSMFSELDTKGKGLGVDNYGISVTTLEEVFIRVGELCEQVEERDENEKLLNNETINLSDSKSCDFFEISEFRKQFGIKSSMARICAMMHKRFIFTRRNLIITAAQIIVPVLLILLACVSSKSLLEHLNYSDPPPFSLDLSKYEDPITVYGITDSAHPNTLLECYKKTLLKIHGRQLQLNNNYNKYNNETDMDNYFIKLAEVNFVDYRLKYQIATEIGPDYFIGFYNDESYHTIAITLSLINNAWLQCLVKPFNTSTEYEIHTINHPILQVSNIESGDKMIIASSVGFYFAILVNYALACLLATFSVFLINERKSGAKVSQYICGATSYTFWLATFIWDSFSYLIPSLAIVIIVVISKIEGYAFDLNPSYVLLSILTYGWASIPLVYLMSFLFSKGVNGFNGINAIFLLTGIGTMIALMIVRISTIGPTLAEALELVFYTLSPSFCLIRNLQNILLNHVIYKSCSSITKYIPLELLCSDASPLFNVSNECCPGKCENPFLTECLVHQSNYLAWKSPGIGKPLVFMTVQGFVFFAILFIVESDIIIGIKRKFYPQVLLVNAAAEINSLGEDSDVHEERNSVINSTIEDLQSSNKSVLILRQLVKRYGLKTLAVNNLCLKVPSGECFGLLGVNGAGKTSTFKMMTGEEVITGGEVYVNGINVSKELTKTRRFVGYCPQFDSLFDQLTVKEHLELHARLRGIPRRRLESYVTSISEKLNIHKQANEKAEALSGGNKRKLCVAIALIGRPKLLFLDEPTTGIDPVARREMWNLLSLIRQTGSTIILTSHSMEECEALCTRLAIMVNGQFKCLGSAQHLKSKFGSGCSVILKIIQTQDQPTNLADIDRAKEFILSHFPGSTLEFEGEGMLNYRIEKSTPGATLANIFGLLEGSREALKLDDYSVGQATLEQIFINFARSQRSTDEEPKVKLFKCVKNRC